MNNILNGVKNLLQLIHDNWTLILVIIGLIIGLYRKVSKYLSLKTDEKERLAWKSLSEIMLALVSEAESNYLGWKEAGKVKRSEVISKIFNEYPILGLITDRQSVIDRIDKMIDESLRTMRKIFENNLKENEKKNLDNAKKQDVIVDENKQTENHKVVINEVGE